MREANSLLRDKLKSYPLYFLPHHLISRIVFKLTRLKIPLKNPAIRWFIRAFNVDMQDAAIQDITRFPDFNAFFTRELRAGARPVCTEIESLASPVDATVSQAGEIEEGRIFQAKGLDYGLTELLGGDEEISRHFINGRFVTLYLSPRDYHRIHMPVSARLISQIYIPGRLYSVAPHTVNSIPRLFARNERLIACFDSAFGPLAMVLVGAINVAAIETVWSGLATPPPKKEIQKIGYKDDEPVTLSKGEEMGRFNMGSTVIVLFNDTVQWKDQLACGVKVKMGEKIGSAKTMADPIISKPA